MTFTPPAGWVEIPVIPNGQMEYDLALRHPTRDIEVRYTVQPLGPLMAEYERERKKPGVKAINPSLLYRDLFHVVLLNVAEGKETEVGEFPAAAIRKEFNADWGATALTSPGTRFGQQYVYCMAMAIHKKAASDAYIFYLFNSKAGFSNFMRSPEHLAVFHSLRFQ